MPTTTSPRTGGFLYSIGHGNRSSETFLSLLRAFEIKVFADVRSYPSSKHNPHFSRESLEGSLAKAGILYHWFPNLGGFRRKGLGSKSPHLALQVLGFRNYADYMNTSPFRTAVDHLTLLTDLGPTCFMCAETVPQRCHRLLLADYLWAQGIKVIHILDHSRTIVHELSRLATITGGRVIYNRPEPQQMELKPND